jgi:acetyl esterase/lipase
VDEMRSGFDEWAAGSMAVPSGVEFETVNANGVRCIWARVPGTTRERTILYFHGGGYVLGSAHAYRGFGGALAKAADAHVLVVDYRRAPENPHPAALKDSVAAYRWLIENDVDPASIILAGDSAGAGLTVAVLLTLREAGEQLPAAGVCLSPWVDMTFSGKSYDSRLETDPIISREILGACAGMWLNGQDSRDVTASPVFADMTGLPPLAVFIGTAECLYDETMSLVERADADGVETDLYVAEEMFHIWPVMNSFLPEAQLAVEQIGSFVIKHTAG